MRLWPVQVWGYVCNLSFHACDTVMLTRSSLHTEDQFAWDTAGMSFSGQFFYVIARELWLNSQIWPQALSLVKLMQLNNSQEHRPKWNHMVSVCTSLCLPENERSTVTTELISSSQASTFSEVVGYILYPPWSLLHTFFFISEAWKKI